MSEAYFTIEEEIRVEQTIEKSRFIATLFPVSSKEEADKRLAEIREEFKDATHNVPAMAIGKKSELIWTSDDGEPQGTSGPPMLRILTARHLTNIMVVVTRYFGGTKLGTGGLVRAYSSTLELALERGKIIELKDYSFIQGETDYQSFNRILAFDFQGLGELIETEYLEKIRFTVKCPEGMEERIKEILDNLTKGGVKYL